MHLWEDGGEGGAALAGELAVLGAELLESQHQLYLRLIGGDAFSLIVERADVQKPCFAGMLLFVSPLCGRGLDMERQTSTSTGLGSNMLT